MNKADEKARAARLFDNVAVGLQQIATTRQHLRDNGSGPMPEHLKQMLNRTRKMLRDAGLPQEVIDKTPGLEPLDWMGR